MGLVECTTGAPEQQRMRTSARTGAGRDCKRWDFGKHVGGCQNYGLFLGTLNIRCRIIIRTQKGTLILTTTHVGPLNSPERIRILMTWTPVKRVRAARNSDVLYHHPKSREAYVKSCNCWPI